MKSKSQEPKAQPQEDTAPPEWQVSVRRVTKDDGRYLIFYDFAPVAETIAEVAKEVEE